MVTLTMKISTVKGDLLPAVGTDGPVSMGHASTKSDGGVCYFLVVMGGSGIV